MKFPTKRPLSLFLLLASFSTITLAANNALFGLPLLPDNVKPVVGLTGGVAWMNNTSGSHTYTGTDDDVFTYQYQNNNQSVGWVGALLGAEWEACTTYPGLLAQVGLEYDYFGSNKLSGTNLVGIEPSTSTVYSFQYKSQTQQVLAVGKLLYTYQGLFHPYLAIGLGASFNQTSGYTAVTSETGSINLTPHFSGESTASFAYRLGLGMELDVVEHVRAGIGYQYNGFGTSQTKQGTVTFNGYQASVPFSLKASDLNANELAFSISYVG